MLNRKKQKFGILFPDGDIKYLIYISPTKDGFAYGVDYSETHITALPKPNSVTFHATNQKTGKGRSLGEIRRDKDFTDLEFQALNPIKVTVDDYDETVIYLTKAWESLTNQTAFDMIERETRNETIRLWDLAKMFENGYRIAHNYMESPESFFSSCTVGELISNPDYICGITNDEKIIIEFDGEWWKIELSHYYNLTKPNHPFEEILSAIGLQELLPKIQQRLKDIISEKYSK